MKRSKLLRAGAGFVLLVFVTLCFLVQVRLLRLFRIGDEASFQIRSEFLGNSSATASGASPVAATQGELPLCYSTATSRKRPLAGSFHQAQVKPAYWNLTCPLEWSKYSCVHQGAVQHATDAASWRFQPQSCRLLTHQDEEEPTQQLLELLPLLSGKHIYFQGDSIVRQLMIAWSCLLHGRADAEVAVEADWTVCGERIWPCHDTVNCITCGPHSGFHFGGIVVKIGDGVEFTLRYGDVNYETLTAADVLITQVAVASKQVTNALNGIEAARIHWNPENLPSIFHFVTWGSHFKTPTGSYDPVVLARLEQQAGGLALLGCENRTRSDRIQEELDYVTDKVDGVLWLDGSNELGKAKVGGTVGAHGDCLHFCLPGPPDEIALALETMIIQHFSSRK